MIDQSPHVGLPGPQSRMPLHRLFDDPGRNIDSLHVIADSQQPVGKTRPDHFIKQVGLEGRCETSSPSPLTHDPHMQLVTKSPPQRDRQVADVLEGHGFPALLLGCCLMAGAGFVLAHGPI
ncbi:MAG: hypothetical protein ACK56I_05980, partial [bacterium]